MVRLWNPETGVMYRTDVSGGFAVVDISVLGSTGENSNITLSLNFAAVKRCRPYHQRHRRYRLHSRILPAICYRDLPRRPCHRTHFFRPIEHQRSHHGPHPYQSVGHSPNRAAVTTLRLETMPSKLIGSSNSRYFQNRRVQRTRIRVKYRDRRRGITNRPASKVPFESLERWLANGLSPPFRFFPQI
jgi:hypothetical protein